jgi:hypothetical protein
VFLWGEPIRVPEKLEGDEVGEWRALVEARMNALTEDADRLVGCPSVSPGTLARHEWRAQRRAAGGRG